MFKGIWRDLVYAGRALAKARSFTFVCVVSLGIGMAPVIAIFYGSQLIAMNPPLVKTEGMVELVTTRVGPRAATAEWSYPDFVSLRDAVTGVAMIGTAVAPSRVTTQTAAGVESVSLTVTFVSADYFRTLGVTLAQGPGFDAAMDQPLKAGPVVILTHDFWQNRMGSDPDIIGKTVALDGVPHVVAGVAPDRFAGHLSFDGSHLFVPLERHPFLRDNKVRSDRGREWIRIFGRLSPGVGVAQASAAVSAVTSQLAKEYPATNEFRAGIAEAYHPFGNLMRSQFTLFQAVALTLTGTVLLVVCLNISGMMQVRGAMRERELSIRQAIGASRLQLARYLLAEAVILAAVGAIIDSLVIFNIPSVVSWFLGQPLPAELLEVLRVDLSMVATSIALCLATSLLFGFLPASRFSRPVIISALKDDAGGGGFRVGRVHRFTAALQVAIAVPLLVMGGITIDRVRATATADLGFEVDLLYAAPLNPEALQGGNADFRIRSLRENLAKADGVAAVTVADGLPLDFRYRIARVSLQVEADVAPRLFPVHVTRVGDGYLNTMGIPLLRGRGFTVDDRAGAESVTVISKTLADQLVADDDVIGKRLIFRAPGMDDSRQQTLTVVGVVADFPTSQMSTEREQLLLPLAQHSDIRRDSVPVEDDRAGLPNLMLIARSAPGEQPAKMTTALENVVREIDPEFKSAGIVTGVGLRRFSMDDFLTQSAVAGVTGAVILTLAALGIYGVVGLMVATRTREIAVRVALGATRRRVMRMILFDVVKLVTPGVCIGVILAAALIRLNSQNMGIELSNVEYLAYIVGAGIAILVAVAASLIPARRAASVAPIVAMRSE